MQLYAVELLAFSAIPICIVRSSGISGSNITQGNVSAGAPPSVDYHSGDPFQQLLEPDGIPYSEERTPTRVSDRVNSLVSRALEHFKPSSWINTDVAFPVMESDKVALAKHVELIKRDVHPAQIEEKLMNPGTAQETVDTWIHDVTTKKIKVLERYTPYFPEWVEMGQNPLDVFQILCIFSTYHQNLFASGHVKILEQYISMYNDKYHTHYSLVETLKEGYDMMFKRKYNVRTTPSSELSKGQAKLAIDLSIAKLSIFAMEDATKLQKELLGSWIENGITADDIFKTLKEISAGRSKERFVSHKYLDTLLGFFELLNENPLMIKTDAFEFLEPKFKDITRTISQLERARKDSAYIERYLPKLFESWKTAGKHSRSITGFKRPRSMKDQDLQSL